MLTLSFLQPKPIKPITAKGMKSIQKPDSLLYANKSPSRDSFISSRPKKPAAPVAILGDWNVLPENTLRERGVLGILDDFEHPTIPLYHHPGEGAEFRYDVFTCHGDVTGAHALMHNPNIYIKARQVPLTSDGKNHNLHRGLQKLNKELEASPRNMDALNISFSQDVSLDRLRNDLDIPEITIKNLPDYRDYIVHSLHKIKFAEAFDAKMGTETQDRLKTNRNISEMYKDCIDMVEDLAQKTPTFISAGNQGHEMLNILLLAKNIHGVGSIDKDGKPCQYSGRNAFVKIWAKTDKKFLPVLGNYGDLAGFRLVNYDYPKRFLKLNEYKPQLSVERAYFLTQADSPWEDPDWVEHEQTGTSFASPQAATREVLRRKLGAPKN
jgi:hypothetical protein